MYDSTYLPEDDLPSWVFYTVECDFCGKVEDEGHDYDEYDIAVCECIECPNEECNALVYAEHDECCSVCGVVVE